MITVNKTIQILIGLMIGAEALYVGANVFTPKVHATSPNATRVPVLVELYTSEGCSDCPPADKLLTELEAKQPVDGAEIIVLGEHVDYWNNLGWNDRFSSAEITARQSQYSQAFNLDSIYTPQMIVDGRIQFVGSNGREALQSIAEAAQQPHANIVITKSENNNAGKNIPYSITVDISNVQSIGSKEQLDVML